MSDVLFRYLLTARQREKSTWRRLLLADDPLLEAGVEQLVETAASRVAVTSQHERITQQDVTVPASRRHSVRFYDVAQPNPPSEGNFERRSEEFPLRDTLRVYTCRQCSGSGKVRCRSCSGRGRSACARCGGSGRNTDANGKRRRCSTCRGSGKTRCFNCHGSGRVTCGDCRGEGKLASWQAEVYRWLVEERSGEEYPLPAEESRVSRAFRRWLEINPERLPSLEPTTVAKHLGFETAAALEVSARGEDHRLRLEGEAKASGDRYMFHRTDLSVAPIGYTVVRLAGKARFYWLVGRGEQALEVKPRGRPDGVKLLGWTGLGAGSVMAFEGLALAYNPSLPLVESMSLLAEAPSLWLVGGSASSWLLTFFAVRRVRRRKPPVPTLGLITATGQPTAFLTCLAYLGSYLAQLKVLDRAYDLQSQRLLGRMSPNRQSESLGIELAGGQRIRLVEVANPQGLSAEQISLMAGALDAVMILEQPDLQAKDLMASLSSAKPAPRIGSLMIDDGLDLRVVGEALPGEALPGEALPGEALPGEALPGEALPGEGLPLEAVRRTFVEDLAVDVDWQAIFNRMWHPIADLLELHTGTALAKTHSEEPGAS